MQKRGKRGLSTVIVTLILILVSLVAVGIIWVVVRNIIQTGTEDVGLSQFSLNAKIMNVLVDNNSNNVSLLVKRNAGQGELIGISFVFLSNAGTEVITKDISLGELEQMRFILHLTNTSVSDLISVSIVPLINQNEKQISGIALDKYNLGSSSGNVQLQACSPTNCSILGYVCGTWNNGTCTGTFSCGACSGGQTCNSNGVCVASCVPATCASLGYQCGSGYANGTCSGTLNCGTCGTGFSCNASGRCVASCVPATCASLGYQCGSGYANGTCSGTLNCGTCGTGFNCIGGTCQAVSTGLCSNLVLLMHFDKNSSVGENNTFVYDWSGNGNYGYPMDVNTSNADLNTPSVFNLTNGKFNLGAGFDGTDDYIRIPVPTTSSLRPYFYNGTISAWIYMSNPTSEQDIEVIGSYSYGYAGTFNIGKTWDNIHFFYIHNNSASGSSGTGKRILSDSANLQLNTWTHYTITWNDTGIYGYINGTLKSANYSKSEFPFLRMYNTWGNYLSIGMLSNDPIPTGWALEGKIDDVAIWNRSLSQTEISNIFNPGTPISC